MYILETILSNVDYVTNPKTLYPHYHNNSLTFCMFQQLTASFRMQLYL